VTSEHGLRRGTFITIEGPEGAGKTTQAERLRDLLATAGRDVVLTREPGGTPLGEAIREILLDPVRGRDHDPRADALLFNAARAQLVSAVVRPALERGATVISTRFADSTLAYQGFGAGLPVDELRAAERAATGGLRPDRTILLDLPAETGLARKRGDELTRFETAFGLAFHRRVRDGFLALAKAEPDRFIVIDASRSADDIAADIAALVAAATRPGEPDALVARIPG
jgi:dTMP kinase